ncbi:hypothetical protein ACLOJK_008062 [Asimina triloba]
MSGLTEGVRGARILEDGVFIELTRRGLLAPLALPAPRGDVDFGEPPARQRELEEDGFLQDRDNLKETTEWLVETKKECLKEAVTANAKERCRGWWRGKGDDGNKCQRASPSVGVSAPSHRQVAHATFPLKRQRGQEVEYGHHLDSPHERK